MTSIKTHQLRVNIEGVETEIIANKFAATTVVNISQTGTFGDWIVVKDEVEPVLGEDIFNCTVATMVSRFIKGHLIVSIALKNKSPKTATELIAVLKPLFADE